MQSKKLGLKSLLLGSVSLWAVHLGAIALFPDNFLVSPSLAANPAFIDNQPLHQNSQAISQYPETRTTVPYSVSAIAKSITVRILTDQGTGSGVIIGHQGQIYTVLTNAHVVAQVNGDRMHSSKSDRYTILTADGKNHTVVWLHSPQLGNYDLALVQFSSENFYQVAAISNSNPLYGEPVYAAGFPNWRVINANNLVDTRDWGLKAFELTQGYIGMLPNQPLQQGYQIGYTNQIEPGMSGGPVLDQYGRLIGINGGLKYPLQGIVAFIFANGTMPNQALFQQMEALSWAIPIARFQELFRYPNNSIRGNY